MVFRDNNDLPVVMSEEFDAPPDRGRVVGVLLAAGTSSRFGDANKLLATVGDEPLVRQAARTLLVSDIDRTTVVVGYEADRVRAALDGLDVDIIENEDYHRGQAASVRTGIQTFCDDVNAAIFALGDMPAVAPRTVDHLIDAYYAGVSDALAAACDGKRGNPALFDACYFDRLADISGDTGGRQILLESDNAALVETGDKGVVLDVDTPEALDHFA